MICNAIKSSSFPDEKELPSFDLRAKQRRPSPDLAAKHCDPCFASRLAGKESKQGGGKKRKVPYSDKEDVLIFEYTREHQMDGKGGVSYWKDAASDLATVFDTARTWQSLKDHYFKHIEPRAGWMAQHQQKKQKMDNGGSLVASGHLTTASRAVPLSRMEEPLFPPAVFAPLMVPAGGEQGDADSGAVQSKSQEDSAAPEPPPKRQAREKEKEEPEKEPEKEKEKEMAMEAAASAIPAVAQARRCPSMATPDRTEVIRQLAVVGQVEYAVAVHVIYVCNGDLRLALRYLKKGDSDKDAENRAWTIKDDDHLRAGKALRPHRSEDAVQARKRFLGVARA